MSRKTVIRIVIAVVAVHLVAFWLVSDMHVLPKRTYIAPPNFATAEGSVIDSKTGDKITVREYTVSTKLRKETPAER